MSGANIAEQWADYITETRYEDLSPEVIHRMKRGLLDALGVGIIGSRYRTCRLLYAFLKRQAGPPQATVLPDGLRTSAGHAALAFGTYVHATELAESFTRAMMHTGNVVVPAALAVAESEGASGRDLLTAMAIGYEISIRVGLAIRGEPNSPTFAAKDETRPTGPISAGGHPVATFGTYGAAAAAAKLMRLDRDSTVHALTIGSGLTPTIGLKDAFPMGAMTKDLCQGVSNWMGVLGAEFAAFGMTGPDDITLHLSVLVPDFERDNLVRGLGEENLVNSGGLHFKLHQTAGMTQSAVDAVLDAMDKKGDLFVHPDDVERVDVEVSQRGKWSMMMSPHPPNGIAAKISIPYVVSAAIAYYDEIQRDPHFTELYTDEKVADVPRRSLAERISISGSPDFEQGFERDWPMTFPARATVHLRSGQRLAGESEIWAVSANLSDDDVIGKFADLTGRVLPKDRIDRCVEDVFALDKSVTVDQVVRSLCY